MMKKNKLLMLYNVVILLNIVCDVEKLVIFFIILFFCLWSKKLVLCVKYMYCLMVNVILLVICFLNWK